MQLDLFMRNDCVKVHPFRTQLLKWVGNKQRFAHEIVSYFPIEFGTYFEPFLGSGAVLGTLAPKKAIGSDVFKPLLEVWQTLSRDPQALCEWYSERFEIYWSEEKPAGYERIKASFNSNPNAADLLFLCRSCYGGVIRFRKADGYMSTPCGVHSPINPDSFKKRVETWHRRMKGAIFFHDDFGPIMEQAKKGDIIYCDPPYTHSQSILYGSQSFDLARLLEKIDLCKSRGVRVALSIDGIKKSGNMICDIPLPDGLFEREIFVNCGRSMLRRFQMEGTTLETEEVKDRLLLTY